MSTRPLVLSALVLATLAAPAVGATSPTTLYDHPIGASQLGADNRGGAVVAWVGLASVKRSSGRSSVVDAIFASARPPGGTFGTKRLLSTPGREAARAFALAVGPAGDAALVWRRASRGNAGAPLLLDRRLPGRSFAAPIAIPGSARGHQPAAAFDARGRLLVAWLRSSGRNGCGSVVMAAVAPRGRGFGGAHRVSGACPNAAMVHAAVTPAGDGAVAWRSGRFTGYTKNTYAIEAAAFAQGRFTSARRVSTGPAAGTTLVLAAGGGGALIGYRDQASVNRTGPIGRVLTATVAHGRIGAPVPVSTSSQVVGPIDVAVNAAGAAIVTWEEGRPGNTLPVMAAFRPDPGTAFAAPERVAPCGATDASRTGSKAALDAAGNALVAFQTACGGSFGIGSNYGLAAARRPAAGPWTDPFALSSGGYAAGVRVVMGDAGEAIAAWSEDGVKVAVLPLRDS